MRELIALLILLFANCAHPDDPTLPLRGEVGDCNEDFTGLPLTHACVLSPCDETCPADQAYVCSSFGDGATCTCYGPANTLLVCGL